MARINLLPWRQEERTRKNKEFVSLALLVGLLTLLALGIVWFLYDRDLSNQQAANELVVAKNTQLDETIKEIEALETQREAMVSRLKVVQDLQGKRSIPVRVWDDLARSVPDGMYLVSLKREGDILTLTGFADNNNVVSSLLRNLDQSPWLEGAAITSIQQSIESYQNANNAARLQNNDTQDSIKTNNYPENNWLRFVATVRVVSSIQPKVDENGNPVEDAVVADANANTAVTTTPIDAPSTTAANEVAPPTGTTTTDANATTPAVTPSAQAQNATSPTPQNAPAQSSQAQGAGTPEGQTTKGTGNGLNDNSTQNATTLEAPVGTGTPAPSAASNASAGGQ